MTDIITTIKAASLDARRNGAEIAGLYSAILGDLDTRSKSKSNVKIGDEEAIAVLKIFLKGVEETISALEKLDKDTEHLDKATLEKEALMSLLPARMDDPSIKDYFISIKSTEGSTMGSAMALLKANHLGKYDGKTASIIAKEIFAG